MKIFEKDGRIHLQLMNLVTKTMLFDFSVEKAFFNELRDHIIANLEDYTLKVEGEKSVGEVQKLYTPTPNKKMSAEGISATDSKPSDVEGYLDELSEQLEPETHCCECTPGVNFQRHTVHIQYPLCFCKKEKFVLKRN